MSGRVCKKQKIKVDGSLRRREVEEEEAESPI
jgi:hypothetical protein